MKELHEIQQRFEDLPNEIETQGVKLATSKSYFKNLDENTKVILSSEMIKYGAELKTRDKKNPPEWKVRAYAYSSEVYKKHLKGLKIAEEQYLIDQALYNKLNIEFECIRSQSSIIKSQMNI